MTVMLLLAAVVAGWIVQVLLTHRQSVAFSRAVKDLRGYGTVAVGAGGRRYRGGRAFVAVACDERGRVTRAITLTGWTTFARPGVLTEVTGLKLSRLRRDEPLPAVREPERLALREAARSLDGHLQPAA